MNSRVIRVGWSVTVFAVVWAAGCNCGLQAAPDGGAEDAGFLDAGSTGGGAGDAGTVDGGPGGGAGDAGQADAGPPDSGSPDAGPVDAGPVDSGSPDAGGPVRVTISPTSAVLAPGGTQGFIATVTGAANPGVWWALDAGTCGTQAGSVSDAGVYTAGSPVDDCQASVHASSVEDPAQSAAAQVSVVVPLTVQVSPASATVRTGLTQQFTATVKGGAVLTVTWWVNGAAGGDAGMGTISATGLYTAPVLVPVPPEVVIRAVADEDGLTAGTAAVTLVHCLGAGVVVDSAVDAVDANIGDGLCADAAGRCTLRAALQEANACSGADRVVLPAGTYTLALPGLGEDLGASGDLDVNGSVELVGAGAVTTVIDAAGLDRVLDVRSGKVVLSDLTLRGGALANGAGIRNQATLTVERCVVSGNSSQWSDGAGYGGGIYNAAGTLTVRRTVVEANAAQVGGGIFNSDSLTLVESTLRGNLVNGGGCAFGGLGNGGGGLGHYQGTTTTILSSTISGNSAPETCFGSGGGAGISGDGALVLVNSTISGNTSAVAGGGIKTSWWGAGSLSLVNCTLAGNSAPSAAALHIGVPSTLTNTIVAQQASGGSCSGSAITSKGHNLDADGTCALTGTGDVSNVPAGLGPLADNGGPTLTHALLAGSPAIDQGDDAVCAAAPVGGVDQRGQARPVDGDGSGGAACDQGAFEAPRP